MKIFTTSSNDEPRVQDGGQPPKSISEKYHEQNEERKAAEESNKHEIEQESPDVEDSDKEKECVCKKDEDDGYKKFCSYGGLYYGVRYGSLIENCGNNCDRISLEFRNYATKKTMCICVQNARVIPNPAAGYTEIYFKLNTTNVHMSSLWNDNRYHSSIFTLSCLESLIRASLSTPKNDQAPTIRHNSFYPAYGSVIGTQHSFNREKLESLNRTSQFVGDIIIDGDASFINDRLYTTALILKSLEIFCVATEECSDTVYAGDRAPVLMNDIVCREIQTRNIREELEYICSFIRENVGLDEAE